MGESFVAVWGEAGFIEQEVRSYGRAFEALAPVGEETVLNITHTDPGNVRVATLAGSEFVVVWDDYAEGNSFRPTSWRGDSYWRRRYRAAWQPSRRSASGRTLPDRRRMRLSGSSGRRPRLSADRRLGLFWFFLTDTNLEAGW
ncbi:MAG: hypothetical protein R2862_01165 [Thermoanaerobaculia bacterium]